MWNMNHRLHKHLIMSLNLFTEHNSPISCVRWNEHIKKSFPWISRENRNINTQLSRKLSFPSINNFIHANNSVNERSIALYTRKNYSNTHNYFHSVHCPFSRFFCQLSLRIQVDRIFSFKIPEENKFGKSEM